LAIEQSLASRGREVAPNASLPLLPEAAAERSKA
jgi:hypothetical protein